MNEILMDKAYNKIKNEYKNYIEEIKKLPVDKIIRNAYEIVCKETIFDHFCSNDYENEELNQLLKLEKPLDYLYNEWLSAEGGISEIINESVANSLEELATIEELDTKKRVDRER